ncbi:MAG: hypothetical protein FJ145_20060 [Deltaproteobacteria bacterium]|nr:hypothetical protein [Deltaproteobacteria bacterium]
MRPRLFLIDGNSYIFRAFFALPQVYSAAGLPTNAVFGFINTVIDLLKQHRPDYLVVTLDADRRNFRHQLFSDYKANRSEPPAELTAQLPYVRKVLQNLGIPLIEYAGYEADDIIATLCRICADECDCVVVSSDKDLMQLVNDQIQLFDCAKNRWIGPTEVRKKFGVAPEQVVEVMGLTGDPVDNIPGVSGIGPKTAGTLIGHFMTLEDLFDGLAEVERLRLRGAHRIRELLEEGKEQAFLSRRLATAKADVPIHMGVDDLLCRAPDWSCAEPLFNELGFANLLLLLQHQRLW